MDSNEYQKLSIRTINQNISKDSRVMESLLGIGTESGEILDIFKKSNYHNHGDVDIEKLKDELGDLLWYISTLSYYYDINLSDIMEFNINKLKKRYPKGFSFEDSKNRDV